MGTRKPPATGASGPTTKTDPTATGSPAARPPRQPLENVALPGPWEAVRAWGRGLLDLLYPCECHLCARPLLPGEATLCPVCRAALAPEPQWHCQRCGAPGFGDPPKPGKRCRLCPPEGSAWQGILSVVRYADLPARAIHLFKYERRLEVGTILAELSALRLGPPLAQLGGRIDCIVPVPLHWTRRLARGFNQSLLLAQTLARASGRPLEPRMLRRTRYTRRQALLPHERRAENVRGAFGLRLPAELVRHKGILLVDDVCTTGTTIQECARVLRAAGAREVWVACFARAGMDSPDPEEGAF